MTSFNERTTKMDTLFTGRVIDLELHEVEMPDGSYSKREIIKHPGAVAVLCVTKEKKLVLVRQYRKAMEKVIAEIPAGKLEEGEDPLRCAQRELEEETGIIAEGWEKLASFYTSPGFADELVHVYAAFEADIGNVGTDEDEFVERVDVTLAEAKTMIASEAIHDAKTMYAVQTAEMRNLLQN
ncbi:NUDIX hydrolase [Alkalicoccus chagannorensis]|uniref:NUDIX hydrolase n=1 Tax=Alkalicoccus chagannorensis TaxID=427072 RepID=UPI0003F5E752|nr:NUDIX hydrolase [Alkalicoccus chagannorensis]